MTVLDFIQIGAYLSLLVVLTPLVGEVMGGVFKGERTFLARIIDPVERLIYRFCGIDPSAEMSWREYAAALLLFNFSGFVVLFAVQLFQSLLPLNPRGLPGVSWHLAFNTAVSFVTNTNWQSYAGETTLSTLVQTAGLTVQNFVSAATGIAVMLALVRGISRKTTSTIGNFWTDLVRATTYVLLPLAIVTTILLAGQGVVQTFSPPVAAATIEGGRQTIPLGPVASQEAIKQIGTNGGGYFNTNSAHPFENPTPFSNFLEMLAILLLPSALVYTYGRMTGSTRHGWTLWGCMMALFIAGLAVSLWSEYHAGGMIHSGGALEGKETRFGVTNSVVWSVATTDASNGSVNAMHDSLSPLSGMVAMLNIMLGEVIFGGVGAGMYGMIVYVILTVFIAGLMVGRSPEYLGKKIEAFVVKMAVRAVIPPAVVILVFSAAASVLPDGLAGLANAPTHRLNVILTLMSPVSGSECCHI